MKSIIVDDDEMSRLAIKSLIDKVDFIENTGEASGGVEALRMINENPVDLMFLDVMMPELSGADILKNVSKLPQIILITGNSDFAVEAFEYGVTDYLVKPVMFPRFLKAVNKAYDIYKQGLSSRVTEPEGAESEDIFIKVDSKLVKLNLDEILWVEALGDYIIFKTPKDRFVVLATMKSIEEKLPERSFIRVHRSYIVNVKKIKDIEDSTILISDKVIPVSRGNREKLMSSLKLL